MLNRRRFVAALGAGVASCEGRTPAAVLARRVGRIVPFRRAQVGEVFQIRRTIPAMGLDQVDPFLMLDHFDFPIAVGERGGLAPHPHRGIETVTVLLEGAIEHGDSLGNRAVLEEGDVQWMTAGSGIVHEENPADILRERGGRVHGIQLWVNLPAAGKALPPGYQDRRRDQIPSAAESGAAVRVIAGTLGDVVSPLQTQTPLALLDATVAAGGEVVLSHPAGWTCFVHVISGVVDIEGTVVAEATLALLDPPGDGIRVRSAGGARFLVGGGAPIAEPLARRGPFAMNTEAELEQAAADYRAGRMGRVANPTYERIRR